VNVSHKKKYIPQYFIKRPTGSKTQNNQKKKKKKNTHTHTHSGITL